MDISTNKTESDSNSSSSQEVNIITNSPLSTVTTVERTIHKPLDTSDQLLSLPPPTTTTLPLPTTTTTISSVTSTVKQQRRSLFKSFSEYKYEPTKEHQAPFEIIHYKSTCLYYDMNALDYTVNNWYIFCNRGI